MIEVFSAATLVFRLGFTTDREELEMTEPNRATIRNAEEGLTIGVVGDIYRFLVTGEETAGRYAMFEAVVLPGGGPPLHLHRKEDETFYVLEGEITFQVGDEKLVARPGAFVNMPIGNPHAFKNETDAPAKMLISFAPAGLEEYFFEVGQKYRGELPPSLI